MSIKCELLYVVYIPSSDSLSATSAAVAVLVYVACHNAAIAVLVHVARNKWLLLAGTPVCPHTTTAYCLNCTLVSIALKPEVLLVHKEGAQKHYHAKPLNLA